MNKKIFASAIIALVATVFSTFASAQIAYTNSVDSAGDAQNANAVAVAGGAAVRANDLVLNFGGAPDVEGDDTIIVRLPAGFNFSGVPTYLVERAGGATATVGLTLKDDTEFGDPTLDDPGITMSDTDGDGGMDRALVTVAAENTAGDTLTISLNVTANSDVEVDETYEARVIVTGNLAVVQEIADVVSALPTPISSAADDDLGNVDQNGTVALGATATVTVSDAKFIVTIPAGTAGGEELTLTPGADLVWGANTGSSITWTVHTPGFAVDPLTPTSASVVVGTLSTTDTVTLATNWTGNSESAVQIQFTINEISVEASDVGYKVIELDGVVTGNARIVEVLPNGSEATISSSGPDAPEIIAGASTPQTLPTINVKENFDGDIGGSFTITAGTGLEFVSAGTVAVSGISASVTVETGSTVITVTIGTNLGGSDTLTISGITAIAGIDTVGDDLTVTVDSDDDFAEFGPKNDVLTVASGVAVGAVTISIDEDEVQTVGKDGYPQTSVVTLMEETYGAITRANATQVNDAYFRITPSANGEITAVSVSTADYAAGTSPTIAVTEACEEENNVTTGAWICKVEAESTAVEAGTSTVSVTIAYESVDATVGDMISMAFDGNSSVNGSVEVAEIALATTAEVITQILDLTPGDNTAAPMATIEITENFTGAVTADGSFRLVAPQGVAFQDAAFTQADASIGTATITATFNPNDTLIMTAALTETITVKSKAVLANGLTGLLTFDLFDGDIEGDNGAQISDDQVTIAYAGDVDDLDLSETALSINAGFVATSIISGGLAPYTVETSSSSVAKVSESGGVVTVTGVSAGGATITVIDSLLAEVEIDVDVTALDLPDAEKGAKPKTSAATFSAGASSDGGATFGTTFTTADDVTIAAVINVDPADQGTAGALHAAVKGDNADGVTFTFLNEDGDFETWDLAVLPGAFQESTSLGSTYTATIFSGQLLAGTYRIALAYTTDGGKLVYTGKAIVITITE